MSSNSSEDSEMFIDSNFKSVSQPYYDPFSKSSVELKEMKKPLVTQQRSSENFETDFGMASGSVRNAYKPVSKVDDQCRDTDDGDDSDQYDRFKSTGVGFSPDQLKGVKANSERNKNTDSYSSDKFDQSKSLYSYYGGENSTYGRVAREAERIVEQDWPSLHRDANTTELGREFAYLYPQKQQLTKENWSAPIRSQAQSGASSTMQTTTQKEKRKKRKEQPPEPNFMLNGAFQPYLETRTFYRNSENSKKTQQATTQNPGSPQALREWFESLSLQDRVNSLTCTYPILVASIIDAHSKYKQQSSVLSIYGIRKEPILQVAEQNALVRRRQGQLLETFDSIFERIQTQEDRYGGFGMITHESSEVRAFMTSIIKFTRITTNKEKNDTITVHSDLIKNAESFFSLMANATNDKAFQEPVYFVTRNGGSGKPIIESPKWINKNSNNYLGVWIVALWEEALWAHFNYAKQVNIGPGVRKNDIQQLFELRSENLQNQEDLAKRWNELGDEGQKKLVENLVVYSKEHQMEQSSYLDRDSERRFSPHFAQYHDVGEYNYLYTNNTSRFGLYAFQAVTNDSIYRQENEYYGNPKGSINSYHLLDQQGVHQSQAKLMMLLVNNQTDTDLKEILDVTGYVTPLELIKFLSEIPLQEINQKGYIRRHDLCRQLYTTIQEDLRQSIQEQLMNDLLAIDSNSSNKNALSGNDAEDKKKKKKSSDVRKQKKKGQAQQQPTPTYQKKKSMSKSPQREELNEANETNKDQEFVKKQQQQRQSQTASNYKPFQKEAHHGVASTTTSDDQTVQTDILSKQMNQKEKSTPPKTANTKREKQKNVSTEQQQSKKKVNTSTNPQAKIPSASLIDETVVLAQVRTLLADLVESVCQQEEERKESETIALEQQKSTEEVEESAKSRNFKGQSEDESKEAPKHILEVDNQVSDPQSAIQASEKKESPNTTLPSTQPKKKRRNNKKKQDVSEIMNDFMRKLHGGDPEEEATLKNPPNNKSKQNAVKNEPEKGQNRRQSSNQQQQQPNAQQNKPSLQNQKTESGRQGQQQNQKPKEKRTNEGGQVNRQRVDTQSAQDKVEVKQQDQNQKPRTNNKQQVEIEFERSEKSNSKPSEEIITAVEPAKLVRPRQPANYPKRQMNETGTVQFFQIQNQIEPGTNDALGGIFIAQSSENQNSISFMSQQPTPQMSTSTMGAFGNQVLGNQTAPQQTAQKEMISLTDAFMKPHQIMFNNFTDFGAKDENFSAQNNIYENSRVRRLDYNQQKSNSDQSSLLDKEISISTPNLWAANNFQKSNESWDNQNQVAMSTTSVSFTPNSQLSPQVSIRSEEQNNVEVSATNLFMQHQNENDFMNGTNQSPPMIKYNSQIPQAQQVDLNFYNFNVPYQQNLMHQQFEHPQFQNQYTGPYTHLSQENFAVGKPPNQKRQGGPFRPPQQFQQSAQKFNQSHRSPTNMSSKSKEGFVSPKNFDNLSQSKWSNERGAKMSPEFQQYSQADFSNHQYPQFELQPNALIRVNAPDFQPLQVQRQNFSNDNWSVNSFQNFDQQNQAYLANANQVQNHQKQGDQLQKDFLFQHCEDAFYAQFDKNITETAKVIQKSIEKFDDERSYVLNMLQQMAEKAFPGSKPVLKMFGSLMTGLALETSDMDVAVTGLRIEDRMAMIDDLHALEHEIKKWPIVKDLKAIDTASIPVIKANLSMKAIAKEMLKAFSEDMVDVDLPIDITFDDTPSEQTEFYRPPVQENPFYQPQNFMMQNYTHMPYGTDFRHGNMIHNFQNQNDPIPQLIQLISGELKQQTVNNDHMNGFRNDFGGSPQVKMHQGMVSCNVIKEYVQNYPCLKEVVLLLKRFLAINNLNSPYQVVAYMNNFNLHKSPHLTPSRLLMGFLEFYCNHFDPMLYGVNTANGGSYYVLPQTNQQQMFVIQDPVQASNNTARNSFRTQDVLNHFRTAFQSLRNLIIKEHQKNLDSEKQLKADSESVTQVVESVQAGQLVHVASSAKAEKSSDGLGARQKQAQHKKGSATPMLDTSATKATEQQHNLQQLSSSQNMNAVSTAPLSLNTTSFGRARFSIAQSFSSVNFVEKFLSREIIKTSTESQPISVEPRQGQF